MNEKEEPFFKRENPNINDEIAGGDALQASSFEALQKMGELFQKDINNLTQKEKDLLVTLQHKIHLFHDLKNNPPSKS